MKYFTNNLLFQECWAVFHIVISMHFTIKCIIGVVPLLYILHLIVHFTDSLLYTGDGHLIHVCVQP